MEALGKQWYNNGAREQDRAVSASILDELWKAMLAAGAVVMPASHGPTSLSSLVIKSDVPGFPVLLIP